MTWNENSASRGLSLLNCYNKKLLVSAFAIHIHVDVSMLDTSNIAIYWSLGMYMFKQIMWVYYGGPVFSMNLGLNYIYAHYNNET